jgi:3D (Asp-Asp-Asp) domain-containing protein
MITNLVTLYVTAYCSCATCCGKANQPTASGRMPVEGITVAGPRRFPFGSIVNIPSVGVRRLDDRLSKKYDNRIDVYMVSHKRALIFGKRKLTVTIITPK